MSNKQTLWLVIFLLLLLWWLWRRDLTGFASFAYVGFDSEGNPVPLVAPPEPVMMPISRSLPWSNWG